MFAISRALSTSLLAFLISHSVFGQQPTAPEAEPTPAEIEARRQAFFDRIEAFGWTREGFGKLGDRAQVAVPAGYQFTDGNGAREMMKVFENLPTQRELGLLLSREQLHWIVFEFDESGYVKDDDKDKLDAGALLKTLQDGQEAANERRREMKLDELRVAGWAVPPRYNDETKNLEWALRVVSSDGGESINYNTRLLGRKGVMEVTLVCNPEDMEGLLAEYQTIMSGFEYLDGEKYAQFQSGDKIAKYGLTGLIAAGGVAAAAKMGLFAKLGGLLAKMGKFVIVIFIAIAAAAKALWSRLFGGRSRPVA